MRKIHSSLLGAALLFALPLVGCSKAGTNAQGTKCVVDSDCAGGGSCTSGICQGGTGGANGGGAADAGCVNLACQQTSCPSGGATTITGHVYDPSGTLPLYNATVYIPNAAVQPFKDGASCDLCNGNISGSPLVTALTNAEGAFTLTNAPAGKDIPLVLQVGKWRRQVKVATVTACTENKLTDPELQRMPRSHAEGDIPQMAIATGQADPLECLLSKMKIDPKEFSLPSGTGRLHMYNSNGLQPDVGRAPAAETLWNDGGTLGRYDVVLLPCEGDEYRKAPEAVKNLVDYTDRGGRVFTTHFGYVWTAFSPDAGSPDYSPFPLTAEWNPNRVFDGPSAVTVDTSFPKGVAFRDWLTNVNAVNDAGVLPVEGSRYNVTGVHPEAGTFRWLYATANGVERTQHLTFNTPIHPPPAADGGVGAQCGRVVYSDFHVSAISGFSFIPTVPSICDKKAFTAQEKALVFMLFDVSSCIQDDHRPPTICGGAAASCTRDADCCTNFACRAPGGGACTGAGCACHGTLQ